MKVYTISRHDLGGGYTTTELDNVKTEFEVELNEFGEDQESGFTKEKIPEVMKSISKLDVLKDDESGTVAISFGPFVVIAGEMSEGEYISLPEFDGW